jgi:hypothetical protein
MSEREGVWGVRDRERMSEHGWVYCTSLWRAIMCYFTLLYTSLYITSFTCSNISHNSACRVYRRGIGWDTAKGEGHGKMVYLGCCGVRDNGQALLRTYTLIGGGSGGEKVWRGRERGRERGGLRGRRWGKKAQKKKEGRKMKDRKDREKYRTIHFIHNALFKQTYFRGIKSFSSH